MSSFPVYPEELDPSFLTRVIGELHPGTVVGAVRLLDAKGFGNTDVSTSARVMLALDYAQNPAELPPRVMVKMLKTDDWPARGIMADTNTRQRPPRSSLYENEVNFYRHFGREIKVNLPRVIAAQFDPESKRYALILEDLSLLDASFPSQADQATVTDMQTLLTALAGFHAQYWQTSRFDADLSWVQTQATGDVAEMLRGAVRGGVRDELTKFKFKRELLERAGTSEEELFAGMAALHAHQATLPQTLIHGDAHFGNSFGLPDGTRGFYDWQLAVQGFCIQDVTYAMITTLSIAQRRQHERELLAYYREQLLEHDVRGVPAIETLWLEYRRATQWCVTIGWLPCPPNAYGWELVVIGNQRTFTAYEDLETKEAIASLL